MRLIASTLAVAFLASSILAADPAEIKALVDKSDLSAALKAFVKDKLMPFCMDETVVAETKAQNDKKIPMAEIEKIDAEWIATKDGSLPIQKEKLSNKCAVAVKKLCADNPALTEVFVEDSQGGNVGQNELTSDYWQGDEPKWIKSFNDGKGGIDIAEAKMDKSSKKVLQQISLPVIDKSGTVIGAVTFGIDIEKVK